MKPNTNEQEKIPFPELDPRASHELNEMTKFCMSIFNPPAEMIAEYVVMYDNLDQRNNAIMMSCFARALMLIGKTLEQIKEIMQDNANCQKYVDAFLEIIDFMMFVKNQAGEAKENADQIIRH